MKKAALLLVAFICLGALTHMALAQISPQKQISDFIGIWNGRIDGWETTRNIHIAIYLLFAIASITSATLHSLKSGPAWLAIVLGILILLGTQVSWLFNVQPTKYREAVERGRRLLDYFRLETVGVDKLKDKNAVAEYVHVMQRYNEELKKLEDGLFSQSVTAPLKPEFIPIHPLIIRTSYLRPLSNECIPTHFDPAVSNTLTAATFNDELPAQLVEEMQKDEKYIYLIGLALATISEEASSASSDCMMNSLHRFISAGYPEHEKSVTTEESSRQISSGILKLGDEIWFRIVPSGEKFYCLRIRRVLKSTVNNYFQSVNELNLKEPKQINEDLRAKVEQTRIIQ